MKKRITKPTPGISRYSLWVYTGSNKKEVYYSFPHLDNRGEAYQINSMQRRLLANKQFIIAFINDEKENRTIKTFKGSYKSGKYRLVIWQPESSVVDRVYSVADLDSKGAYYQFNYLKINYLDKKYKSDNEYLNSTAVFELAADREIIVKMYGGRIVSINPKYISRDEIQNN